MTSTFAGAPDTLDPRWPSTRTRGGLLPPPILPTTLPLPGDPAGATAIGSDAKCGTLLGRSAPMLGVYDRIRRVAPTLATVLLSGATGTGKELVARAVHDLSDRSTGPFIALNCGAVAASLVESELFGHERGSFTGAARRHHGVFAQAGGGTLFLDEVTEMGLDLQVRLLRVLETGTFQRIGGEELVHTDARIVAATNRDPLAEVRAGRLREDLYYRLAGFPIVLPPLHDRGDDIELLARHFLATLNTRHGLAKAFSTAALARLRSEPWPGNVRQLQNVVQQAFLMADRTLGADQLPRSAPTAEHGSQVAIAVGMSVATAEHQLILATLAHCEGNKTNAAHMLGISLKTLYGRLSVYAAATQYKA